MSDVLTSYETEHNGLRYRVCHIADQDASADFLGEYTSEFSEYCVDRRKGILYGEPLKEQDHTCIDSEDGPIPEDCKQCAACLREEIEEEQGHAMHSILATGLPTCRDSRTYEYFKLGTNHLPFNMKNWEHVSTEDRQAAMERRGVDTLERVAILQAVEDYRRAEDLNNGQWWYIAIEVTLLDSAGNELDSAMASGEESDAGNEHLTSITNELISEIEGRLTETAQRLCEESIKLMNLSLEINRKASELE